MKLLLNLILRQKAHVRLIMFTVGAMILLTIANALEIFAIGFITNKQAGANSGLLDRVMEFLNPIIPIKTSFVALGIFIVLVSAFKASALFSQRLLAKTAAIKISQDLRDRFFAHIQKLPMSFYHEHNIGALSSRVVGDAYSIAEAVNASIVNYIQTPFVVLTSLTLCFLTSWQLSLLIFFGFPLLLFPIWFLSKKVKKIARDIQKNQEKFTSVLIDFIGGVQTVKLFAEESFSLHKYRELNEKMGFLEQKSAKYDLLSRPVVHTIAMFFLVMALIFGLYVLEMPVADVLFFCGMLYLFYEPIKKFAEENSHIQRGIAAAERMEEVISLPVEAKKEEGPAEFSRLERDIEFKNVWFKYNDEWVLKNLSFTIKKGELVALVGATGAGKSTVAQLLPRLWDYQKGDILIDGKSLLTFTQESLRRHIAYVPQKSFLFLDTIKENIRFGGRFSDQEVVEAAKQAHSHEFIEKLPKGYDTYLSEGGKNLSGGQQQRLTIARALIKKSPLLIMDEATSSLDALSEHYIKETIQNLKNEVTQIVIAHRLSTIENADKILFLEKGELVAQGTKDELLKTCPPFKRLWDLLLLNNNN